MQITNIQKGEKIYFESLVELEKFSADNNKPNLISKDYKVENKNVKTIFVLTKT